MVLKRKRTPTRLETATLKAKKHYQWQQIKAASWELIFQYHIYKYGYNHPADDIIRDDDDFDYIGYRCKS